jgi:hypothetical protein
MNAVRKTEIEYRKSTQRLVTGSCKTDIPNTLPAGKPSGSAGKTPGSVKSPVGFHPIAPARLLGSILMS